MPIARKTDPTPGPLAPAPQPRIGASRATMCLLRSYMSHARMPDVRLDPAAVRRWLKVDATDDEIRAANRSRKGIGCMRNGRG